MEQTDAAGNTKYTAANTVMRSYQLGEKKFDFSYSLISVCMFYMDRF